MLGIASNDFGSINVRSLKEQKKNHIEITQRLILAENSHYMELWD